MKSVLIALVLSLFVGTSAFGSQWSSQWHGQGTMNTPRWGLTIAVALLTIQHTPQALTVRDCWSYQRNGANWQVCASNRYQIMNHTELWLGGRKVGSIDSRQIKVDFYEDVDGERYTVRGRIDRNPTGTLDFDYESRDSSGAFSRFQAFGLVLD